MGVRLFRQRAKQARRRRGASPSYDDRALGPIAEESLCGGRQAVGEEWVLCDSILSLQREPTGESIIRRDKLRMLPQTRLPRSAITPSPGKNYKTFSYGSFLLMCPRDPARHLSLRESWRSHFSQTEARTALRSDPSVESAPLFATPFQEVNRRILTYEKVM
jgi:hypothetical protein